MEIPNRREAIGAAMVMTIGFTEHRTSATEGPTQEKIMVEPDSKVLQRMIKKAKSISEKAYCPYSKFQVGAAVLTEDGQIFEGCNVENASYGLTICAERNAIFQMVAQTQKKLVAIVIYTPTPVPVAPCGACRQVINEFGPNATIVCVCDGSDVLKKKLFELLPDSFGPSNLAK